MHAEPLTLELARRLPHRPPRSEEEIQKSIAMGPVYVIFDGDTAIACAGAVDQGCGNAAAYVRVQPWATCSMVAIHRVVRRLLEASPFRRIEVVLAASDANGARFARALGFESEGVARAWCFDGGDGERYARVRKSADTPATHATLQ
jgi:hypothetical protein